LRDKPYAPLQQLAFRDGGIGEVSKDPATHIDHDVTNHRVIFDVAQQPPKHWSVRDRLRRLTWLDELPRDRYAELMRLALRLDSLVAMLLPSASTSAVVESCRVVEPQVGTGACVVLIVRN
jgi:hypothetical protein